MQKDGGGSHASELLERAREERIRGGNRSSLESLLAGYGGYLRVLSRARFDSRLGRRLTINDLVQDTLLEAYRDFPKFSGTTTAEFTGWLRKILINNANRELETHLFAAKRDVRREQRLEGSAGSLSGRGHRLSTILLDQGRSPASEVEHQDLLASMACAIEKLKPDYREVIVLRHIEGLAFNDVATRMCRSVGSTRMLWLRALEKLREQMNP